MPRDLPEHPRFLILGAQGGLGRALVRRLAFIGDVIAWSRADLDLSRMEDIKKKVETQPFDVLLNPAGMTSPDDCETRQPLASMLNTMAPAALAAICHRLGRRFIHFSTDYVFDGTKTSPWNEEDPARPVNHYGRSKREGEIAVLQANPQALVARVSWLFGPDKASHPDQILAKARQGSELTAIADKTSAPTFTRDLCDWIARMIIGHPEVSGTLHLCNQGTASWHDWGLEALRIAEEIGMPLKTRSILPLRLAESTFFQAARPPHTTMDTTRLTRLTGIQPRSWREALREHLQSCAATAGSGA